jgi:hypothetical protein
LIKAGCRVLLAMMFPHPNDYLAGYDVSGEGGSLGTIAAHTQFGKRRRQSRSYRDSGRSRASRSPITS